MCVCACSSTWHHTSVLQTDGDAMYTLLLELYTVCQCVVETFTMLCTAYIILHVQWNYDGYFCLKVYIHTCAPWVRVWGTYCSVYTQMKTKGKVL